MTGVNLYAIMARLNDPDTAWPERCWECENTDLPFDSRPTFGGRCPYCTFWRAVGGTWGDHGSYIVMQNAPHTGIY